MFLGQCVGRKQAEALRGAEALHALFLRGPSRWNQGMSFVTVPRRISKDILYPPLPPYIYTLHKLTVVCASVALLEAVQPSVVGRDCAVRLLARGVAASGGAQKSARPRHVLVFCAGFRLEWPRRLVQCEW